MFASLYPTFRDYMRAVNAALLAQAGLTAGDLGDYCYRDAFADEVPPAECAEEVLSDNGFPFAE